MKKENQIVPVNSNLTVQKVHSLLKLTDKLSKRSSSSALVIYASDNYEFQYKVKSVIPKFIIRNFWFFIKDIVEIAKNNSCYSGRYEISLLKEIRKNDLEYEYLKIGGFKEKNGIINRVTTYDCNGGTPKVDENFRKLLINKLNASIVGEILVHFDKTSVSNVLGYKIKTAGNNVYST